MRRIDRVLSTASLAGGIPGLVCAVYGFLSLRAVRFSMEQAAAMPPESTSLVIAASIVGLFLFHVLAVAATIADQVVVRRFRGFRAFTIVLGVLSGVLVVADVTMLQDIGNQFEAGMSSAGEWQILEVSYTVHCIYAVLALAMISLTMRTKKEEELVPVSRNEALFVTLSFVGLYTGCMGMLSLLLAAAVAPPPSPGYARVTPAFAFVALIPYLVALTVWGVERVRARSLWADEKQMSDSHGAAFRAAVASLPVMCALYVLERRVAALEALWLPVLLFLWLLTYSAAVLRRWRRS